MNRFIEPYWLVANPPPSRLSICWMIGLVDRPNLPNVVARLVLGGRLGAEQLGLRLIGGATAVARRLRRLGEAGRERRVDVGEVRPRLRLGDVGSRLARQQPGLDRVEVGAGVGRDQPGLRARGVGRGVLRRAGCTCVRASNSSPSLTP
jgi:hypothetical protein